MKLLSKTKTVLASLALVALAGGAQADVVRIQGHVANGINYVDSVSAPTVYDGVAALWNVTNLDTGTSFLAYCLELLQSVDATNPQNYTSGVYAPSADVQELYDRYYGTVLQSRARAIGFQLALWELTGQVSVASFAVPSDAIGQANLLLDGVANSIAPYAPNSYRFVRWSNNSLQDVLQATVATNTVAEPQTHALLLGGLGLMVAGMVSRRRRGRSDKSL